MKERIKAIRKELNLTQQEFANRMGVKRNPIAGCEAGRTEPSQSLISLICRTYNVNEVWLRTGEGEMFVPRTRHDEIAIFLGDLSGGNGSEFQQRLVSVMAKLTKEQWDFLEQLARDIAKEKDPAD